VYKPSNQLTCPDNLSGFLLLGRTALTSLAGRLPCTFVFTVHNCRHLSRFLQLMKRCVFYQLSSQPPCWLLGSKFCLNSGLFKVCRIGNVMCVNKSRNVIQGLLSICNETISHHCKIIQCFVLWNTPQWTWGGGALLWGRFGEFSLLLFTTFMAQTVV
jgi:hypothetical protein